MGFFASLRMTLEPYGATVARSETWERLGAYRGEAVLLQALMAAMLGSLAQGVAE